MRTLLLAGLALSCADMYATETVRGERCFGDILGIVPPEKAPGQRPAARQRRAEYVIAGCRPAWGCPHNFLLTHAFSLLQRHVHQHCTRA